MWRTLYGFLLIFSYIGMSSAEEWKNLSDNSSGSSLQPNEDSSNYLKETFKKNNAREERILSSLKLSFLLDGINTFSAFTSIPVSLVKVVTAVVIAWPFLVILLYFSLIVFFPDPKSHVTFERDVALTVRHLKSMALEIEDRILDFLEELTDPNKYPSTDDYGNPYHEYSHSSTYSSIGDESDSYDPNFNAFHGSDYDLGQNQPYHYSSQPVAYNQVPYSSYLDYISPVQRVFSTMKDQAQTVYNSLLQNYYKKYSFTRPSPLVSRPLVNTMQSSYVTNNPYAQYGFATGSDSLMTRYTNSYHFIKKPLRMRNQPFNPVYNSVPATSLPLGLVFTHPLMDHRGETIHTINSKLNAFVSPPPHHLQKPNKSFQDGYYLKADSVLHFNASPVDLSIIPKHAQSDSSVVQYKK